MLDLFCKPFVFNANRYEVWQDQKCISQGTSKLKIVGVYAHNLMSFRIIGDSNLNIEPAFSIRNPSKLADRIQYGLLPQNMVTNYPTVPKVCNLFFNPEYIRFALLSPLRIVEFYGSYDKNAEILPIEENANEMVRSYIEGNSIISEGIELLRDIKRNPNLLLKVQNPQIITHAVMALLFTNAITDLDTLELAGNIGYWSISKAIELEPQNKNLYFDRLSLMINAPEALKWATMKALNLTSGFLGRFGRGAMAEFMARDAVYLMTIADMYNHPETYQKNQTIRNHKLDMDDKITHNFFSQIQTIEQAIKQGENNHNRMFNDLTKRIEDNDFDI